MKSSPVSTRAAVSLLALVLTMMLGGGAASGTVDDRPGEEWSVRLQGVIDLGGSKVIRTLRRIAGLPVEGSPLERPWGAAWDGDDLVVTDPGARRVLRVSGKGRLRRTSTAMFTSPIGVAVCPQGIVVSDSGAGTVALLDRDLELRRLLAEGLARPTGIACSRGEIFVAETAAHRIVVLGEGGTLRTLGRRGEEPGELNFPTAVATAGDDLWVGDTLNFRLQRLDRESGEPRGFFGQLGDAPGEMPRLKGIAVDAWGHLWVADAHLDQVALFGADGTYLMAVGGSGTEVGQFSFPAGIAAHSDGRVVVVDSLNRRLQLFVSVAEGGRTR